LGALPVHIAPRARLDAGLDAVAPARVRRREVPALLSYVMTGKLRPGEVRTLHDVDRIEARCERPLPLQADGEDLGDVASAVFEAERAAIGVLV
jgi:diacylglycerol kinase family enzyme